MYACTWYLMYVSIYACVSIRMYSYASVTHPYAPIGLHTPPYPSIMDQNVNIKHICSPNKANKVKSSNHCQIIFAIVSVKLLWIQPNIPNWLNIGKPQKPKMQAFILFAVIWVSTPSCLRSLMELSLPAGRSKAGSRGRSKAGSRSRSKTCRSRGRSKAGSGVRRSIPGMAAPSLGYQ